MKLFGHDIKLKKINRKANYENIYPGARYAPWLNDNEFNKNYEIIKDYTLVDKYRCYELWKLMEEVRDVEGAIIEIGVWRGGTGLLIAKKAQTLGINDSVYLCDTFSGVVNAGHNDSTYIGGEHSNAPVEIVKGLSEKLITNNSKILKGIFPDETSNLIKDDKFRFCHIDVDVYESAKDSFEWVWDRLEVGGIIVFDDYGFDSCDGVRKLVDEQRGKKDRVVIHNLNGHAIIVKLVKRGLDER